ncbi:MAG: F0F1 ATP synthase subunit A [Chloroflexi bacterium]|nr:F0F1 ATP synthase subunit A [Chloroflexota bacterium]
MKKRYIILLFVALLILQSAGVLLPSPVRPYIQLPGEVYPGTSVTNTFVASLVAYLIVILIAVFAKARQRTADEVPTGFYNFLEMIVEGAYGFSENIAGSKKVKDFFPFFMTYILFILVSNWMGLLPGWIVLAFGKTNPTLRPKKRSKRLKHALNHSKRQAKLMG